MKKKHQLFLTVSLLILWAGCTNSDSYKISTSSNEKTLLKDEIVSKNLTDKSPAINDFIVFHVPNGDTVYSNQPELNYYQISKEIGKANKDIFGKIEYRPIEKREIYIFRCLGMPNDTFQIVKGEVKITGKSHIETGKIQFKYIYISKYSNLTENFLKEFGISQEDYSNSRILDTLLIRLIPDSLDLSRNTIFVLPLTTEKVDALKKSPSTIFLKRIEKENNYYENYIFPHDTAYKWNEDNFGPLWIPQKGATIQLSLKNLPLYRRIISVYEENILKVENGTIYINEQAATNYTFEMNYYFLIGENRHNASDSRFWGFVPENHIIGKINYDR